MQKALEESIVSGRADVEQRIQDGQFDHSLARWTPTPMSVPVKTLTYFGEEVPTVIQPQDLAQGELVFRDFGTQYSLDQRMFKFLVESEGIDSFERFRYAYSEDYDFKALVIKAGIWCNQGEIPHATVQAADFKLVWTEVTGCYRRRIRRAEETTQEADLDSPMPGNTLASARLRFFLRGVQIHA